MFELQNRMEPSGSIWPELPCSYGIGMQGQTYICITGFDSFNHVDCFGCHKFATQFIKERKSAYCTEIVRPRTTLNERGALMLLSILTSIIEKKYIASFGSSRSCVFDCMLNACLNFDCDNFSHLRYYNCREKLAYSGRRMIYAAFNEALRDLVIDYADASSTERSFGTIFPNCPYKGDMPDWNQDAVYSLYGFVEAIINNCDGYGCDQTIFSDITQRSNYLCGLPTSRKHKDMFGDVFQISPLTFESRGSGYRPALRYVLDELKCLSHCDCTIESFWCKGGSVYSFPPICSLGCMDYVEEWVSNLRRLYDCGFLHGCVCESTDPSLARHKYCHVFGGVAYANVSVVGIKHNPFAASIAMTLLNTFAKYQVTRQNLNVGYVCHITRHRRWWFTPSYSTRCKSWSIDRNCASCCASTSYNKKAVISICVPRVSGISIAGDLVEGLLPRVMKYYGTCLYALCYYRCSCFDNSGLVSGIPWGRHCTGSGIQMFDGSIDVYVTHPARYRCMASLQNNFVHLSYPTEAFPHTSSCVVSDRICTMRNVMMLRQCADYLPWGQGRSGFRVLYTDWDGCRNDGFLRTSAFCNVNRAILCVDEKTIVCKMHALGYCAFENPVDSFNAGYFGFGDNGFETALWNLENWFPSIVPKFDKVVAECVGFECGESVFAFHYFRITEDECVEITPEAYPFEPYRSRGYVLFRDARSSVEVWSPQECGRYGLNTEWRTLSVFSAVQFGGFFQINNWNFGSLAPRSEET